MQMGAAIGLAALGAISTAHAQTLMAQGQTVSAAVIRPSGGGARRPERVELDRAEAEAA